MNAPETYDHEDDGYEFPVLDGEDFLDWLLGDDAWDRDPEA